MTLPDWLISSEKMALPRLSTKWQLYAIVSLENDKMESDDRLHFRSCHLQLKTKFVPHRLGQCQWQMWRRYKIQVGNQVTNMLTVRLLDKTSLTHTNLHSLITLSPTLSLSLYRYLPPCLSLSLSLSSYLSICVTKGCSIYQMRADNISRLLNEK